MTVREIETKIFELKGKQSEVFKKKKAERNLDELSAVRDEINALKKEAAGLYKAARAANKKN